MNSKVPDWMFTGVRAFALACMLLITCQCRRKPTVVSAPQERAVAESVLTEKLSGPGYFTVPDTAIREDGGPWIPVSEAIKQIPRVVAARNLDANGNREIEEILTQLAEPHPSRRVGGERIQLSRLNLSLDALK